MLEERKSDAELLVILYQRRHKLIREHASLATDGQAPLWMLKVVQEKQRQVQIAIEALGGK